MVSVSAVPRVDLAKLSTKSAQDCSESLLALQNCKKLRCAENFWKMRSAKCEPDFTKL